MNFLEENKTSSNSKVAVFVDKNIYQLYPMLKTNLIDYFKSSHFDFITDFFILHDGEHSKNDPHLLNRAYRYIKDYKIDRHSFIISIGGGAANDFTGFVSSSAHRGIKLVRVPTTVLAQNDASIGVKNAINFEGSKNFIGNFQVPLLVLNDSNFLKTLDHANFISGYAESIKISLIKDRTFFKWIETNCTSLKVENTDAVNYLIEKTAELHINHFSNSGDAFETGNSRPLDFGHWFAHKIESVSNFKVLHGEAVAIGIYLDSLYSLKIGSLDDKSFARINFLLHSLGLLKKKYHLERIKNKDSIMFEALNEFQEHLGGELSIPLLTSIGSFENTDYIDIEIYKECIKNLLTKADHEIRNQEQSHSTDFLY